MIPRTANIREIVRDILDRELVPIREEIKRLERKIDAVMINDARGLLK